MNSLSWSSQHIYARDAILCLQSTHHACLPRFNQLLVHTSFSSEDTRKKMYSGFLACEMITGQKPKKTYAKNFVAGFKIRKNQLLGCVVSLRKQSLFSFLQKFSSIKLPKIREFTSLDASSKVHAKTLSHEMSRRRHPRVLSRGFKNFLLFPELENHYELFSNLSGFEIHLSVSGTQKKTYDARTVRFVVSSYQLPF